MMAFKSSQGRSPNRLCWLYLVTPKMRLRSKASDIGTQARISVNIVSSDKLRSSETAQIVPVPRVKKLTSRFGISSQAIIRELNFYAP
jgi:hypothetical protein